MGSPIWVSSAILGSILDNFLIRSRISTERIKISSSGKRHYQPHPCPHSPRKFGQLPSSTAKRGPLWSANKTAQGVNLDPSKVKTVCAPWAAATAFVTCTQDVATSRNSIPQVVSTDGNRTQGGHRCGLCPEFLLCRVTCPIYAGVAFGRVPVPLQPCLNRWKEWGWGAHAWLVPCHVPVLIHVPLVPPVPTPLAVP